jgi:hypothetical protein
MQKLIIFACLCLFVGCKEKKDKMDTVHESEKSDQVAKVTMAKNGDKFQLMVNGDPFYINGAGLEFGDVAALARHNGNSFRTWRTENGQKTALEVLDEAHKHGIKVTMGIEVARERHGFDYDDEEAVAKQLEEIRQQVIALKDHPAMLIWGIGNELNLRYTNPKVWDAVNEISEMIHEVDPNHLTTTSLAGLEAQEVNYLKERCPDLDILSVQMYGDLPKVPGRIREYGWEGPYMVTEWGATGHWEVPTTSWGAPIEQNSTVKAENYLKRFKVGIESDSTQCIGSYVFLWGNKQERTPTWYGIFLEDGQETESVDVMHYIWNGSWPANRTPKIVSYELDGKTAEESVTLEQGEEYKASISTTDYEGDPLSYKWEILPEATDLQDGGDHEERPEAIEGMFISQEEGTLEFKSPSKGVYRLFVYVNDGQDHSATANIPFKVN